MSEKKTFSCDHQFRDPYSRMRTGERCGKDAKWEVKGWAARFGVPLSGYFCDEHIDANGPGSHPKIMPDNRWGEVVVKLK